MTSRIRWGFRSYKQLPWFMVWREYLDGEGEVEFAVELFQFWPTREWDLRRYK